MEVKGDGVFFDDVIEIVCGWVCFESMVLIVVELIDIMVVDVLVYVIYGYYWFW